MALRLFNTLTREKEPFSSLEPGVVRMYSCGPTVYNFFHIGNARPFIVFDTLRRFLEYRGYEVRFVQNFTDIDDKMIRRAREEGISVDALAERYIAAYFEDADRLGIRRATAHPRATRHIQDMLDIISSLVDKGHAYVTEDGVYFHTASFPEYGKLSRHPLEELESGARVDVDERKRSPLDFALWKFAKEGEPAWDSPFGPGRPGWHIECSAMSRHLLGDTLDIHSGGQDLVFPHHENEIAQSECATGHPFVRYWLHNGFITVDQEKMSKSAGNFFTVRDILKEFPAQAIRLFMLSAQYRSPINFSREMMEAARAALERIRTCGRNLVFRIGTTDEGGMAGGPATGPLHPALDEARSACDDARAAFITAMEDDLNTADALAALFDLVRVANIALARPDATPGELALYLATLEELGDILGLRVRPGEDGVPAQVAALVEERAAARKARDWKRSDEIRDQLRELGWSVEDTPAGPRVSKT